jgi:hypothetical protein
MSAREFLGGGALLLGDARFEKLFEEWDMEGFRSDLRTALAAAAGPPPAAALAACVGAARSAAATPPSPARTFAAAFEGVLPPPPFDSFERAIASCRDEAGEWVCAYSVKHAVIIALRNAAHDDDCRSFAVAPLRSLFKVRVGRRRINTRASRATVLRVSR